MAKKPSILKLSGSIMGNENKKVPKPLIERKRRARMNRSLSELESLLSEFINQFPLKKGGKVEKADILEIAVDQLKTLKSDQDPAKAYKEGYNKCLEQVKLFLGNNDSQLVSTVIGHIEEQIGSPANCASPAVACSVIRFAGETGSPQLTVTDDSSGLSLAPNDSMWRPW
ncbi:Transcription factor HES-2 [Halotydeus destructor]|nr:Transcription factor HES-2 [Halotydeus destructor]